MKDYYWSEDDDAFLRSNWRALSAAQIARRVGRSRNAVIGRARRKGYLKDPSRPPTGDRLSRAMRAAIAGVRPWMPGDPIPERLRLF